MSYQIFHNLNNKLKRALTCTLTHPIIKSRVLEMESPNQFILVAHQSSLLTQITHSTGSQWVASPCGRCIWSDHPGLSWASASMNKLSQYSRHLDYCVQKTQTSLQDRQPAPKTNVVLTTITVSLEPSRHFMEDRKVNWLQIFLPSHIVCLLTLLVIFWQRKSIFVSSEACVIKSTDIFFSCLFSA